MSAIVIGNIALDENFSVPALPRPGETLLATNCSRDLGGKGANQAVVLARSGVLTRLVARIGKDQPAVLLRDMLTRERLNAAGLIVTDAPTDRSMVLLAADGENCIISTAHCARALTGPDVTAALGDADASLLLMQGNLRVSVTRTALEAAHERGMTTVFTPAPIDPEFATLWPFADLVVLNRMEARELAKSDNAAEAASRICAAGATRVVVTLGAEGAIMAGADGLHTVPAIAATVCDTTGAGDTFTAVLAAALFVRRMEPAAALRSAASAAAITVSRRGTLAAFPSAAELGAILIA